MTTEQHINGKLVEKTYCLKCIGYERPSAMIIGWKPYRMVPDHNFIGGGVECSQTMTKYDHLVATKLSAIDGPAVCGTRTNDCNTCRGEHRIEFGSNVAAITT
jgi:hypothetical protein